MANDHQLAFAAVEPTDPRVPADQLSDFFLSMPIHVFNGHFRNVVALVVVEKSRAPLTLRDLQQLLYQSRSLIAERIVQSTHPVHEVAGVLFRSSAKGNHPPNTR